MYRLALEFQLSKSSELFNIRQASNVVVLFVVMTLEERKVIDVLVNSTKLTFHKTFCYSTYNSRTLKLKKFTFIKYLASFQSPHN